MAAAREVTIDPWEPTYPARARALAPVPRLHLRGHLPAGPALAVVGSRAATRGDLDTAHALSHHVAGRGVAVISGGALGVDAAAHRGALAAGGTTVVVLGNGLDLVYPDRHHQLFAEVVRTGGALVTMFPAGTPPRAWHFVRRNQLIAALADVVLVVAARVGSGALHTARAAARLGRRLAAVPGTPGAELLLAAGAAPVAGPAELDAVLAGRATTRVRPPPTPEAARVLAAIVAAEAPAGLEALCAGPDLGLTLGEVALCLCELEADGWILPVPGGAYVPAP